MKNIDWKIVIAGLVCITALEIVALMQGIDGVILTSVVGILALVVGVAIPSEKVLR